MTHINILPCNGIRVQGKGAELNMNSIHAQCVLSVTQIVHKLQFRNEILGGFVKKTQSCRIPTR